MRVRIAYGRAGLELHLKGDVTVLEQPDAPAIADPPAAIRQALRNPIASQPLRELVRAQDRVAIVFSDITRPMPTQLVLPVLLQELSHVREDNILLINALGTHRPNTAEELELMLGPDVCRRCRIVQHDALDELNLVSVGHSARGYPLLVNRLFVQADCRILTGLVEPHFFAGYSGGAKSVLPGIAGMRTILHNHDYEMLSHPKATWLEAEGNPVYEEIELAGTLTAPHFVLNVALNRDKQLSSVFAGSLLPAHAAARDFVRSHSQVLVEEPFDIVITSNGGYPLDLNLYQCVKGMSAAARIVRPGGAIIVAGECWDGLPEHSRYASLLRAAQSPADLLERIKSFPEPERDQWQAQIQAQVQLRADVYVFSHGLTEKQMREALLNPCQDIEQLVSCLVRQKGPRVGVLPQGPFTVPTLA